uniref:Heme chaperone HemW n=1 Tax=uncultured bacterium contig00060 TaxID=1181543 RepID=A0A806KER4_9BACT|nr:putative coproporphyrinogen III oxidase [uncultured bacterium contig00060]
MSLDLSLYIHIPFCSSFCDYCDFFSVKTKDVSDEYIEKYLKALITDINYQIEYFNVRNIPTVYIGGGTPSVPGKRIKILLDALNKIKNFSPLEFTVEANPESISEEFLCICKEGGVNRLSLGVQTFHEPARRAVNRAVNCANNMLEEKITIACRYFPDSISLDLVTGLPCQTEKTAIEDIKRILDFSPSHVSLYSLTVEKGTPLETKIKTKELTLPGNELSDSLWFTSKNALEEAGFLHYEVSNFAKNGKECLHNIRYWRMEEWLGAGTAASGTVIDRKNKTAKRYTYKPDIDAYINSPLINTAICENIDMHTLICDFLLMGYRYYKGPDEEDFKKIFNCGIEDFIPRTLLKWKNKDKMLFLNSFLSDAFEELG